METAGGGGPPSHVRLVMPELKGVQVPLGGGEGGGRGPGSQRCGSEEESHVEVADRKSELIFVRTATGSGWSAGGQTSPDHVMNPRCGRSSEEVRSTSGSSCQVTGAVPRRRASNWVVLAQRMAKPSRCRRRATRRKPC